MTRKQMGLLLAAIMIVPSLAHGQQKEETESELREKAQKAAAAMKAAEAKSPVALTVQVVFSEYEGDRKISSLPYTMPLNSYDDRRAADWEQLRMGIRVPIMGKDGNTQYMDVGTNIDALSWTKGSGEFDLGLRVERTSVYSVDAGNKPAELSQPSLSVSAQPIVRHYRSTMTLRMRDGQTVQRSLATDPVSGRVLKVDVTLNVVK